MGHTGIALATVLTRSMLHNLPFLKMTLKKNLSVYISVNEI